VETVLTGKLIKLPKTVCNTQRDEHVMTSIRAKTHEIIFGADTPAGKAFDILLLLAIIASVFVVAVESVDRIREEHGALLKQLEWAFTIIFTLEYALRIFSLSRPRAYIFSFYGIIDFLSIVPTYLSIIIAGSQALLVIRILRLIRVFRVLKLVRYLGEANILSDALRSSLPKIIVFLVTVFAITVIMGTVMYIVEGPGNGFTSIPTSIYWCIVTLTTVGYGDIAPQTTVGQTFASIIMILGYGIIAVPTGIVTSELALRKHIPRTGNTCPGCGKEDHERDARYCKYCGTPLNAKG
jgi:voltage-gated potassium channel